MRILADGNMRGVEGLFSSLGEVLMAEGRSIQPQQLEGIDILLVRSVTPVNEALLAEAGVSFVGSATAGTDHVDVGYLERCGIPFSAAPGCNADAVGDYVLSAIAHCDDLLEQLLAGERVGLVGFGHVGRTLQRRFDALGITALAYDPWLEQASTSSRDTSAG